jgi:hypothetical protein
MSNINDEYIINLFKTEKGKINYNYMKNSWLDSHADVKKYLISRYSDSESILETCYRIVYCIDKHPLCPVCGKPTNFDPKRVNERGSLFTTYCSKECSSISEDRKNHSKIAQSEAYEKIKVNKKTNRTKYDYWFKEQIEHGLHVEITEKDLHDEWKYFCSKPGDLTAHPNKNKIVLAFQQDNFYKKEKYLFSNDVTIRQKLIENRMKYLGKSFDKLTDGDLLRGFKISGIFNSYSHFSPLWTKYFAEMYNCKVVADPFGGWGHHLVGLVSAGCKVYYNDIVENVVNDVKKIAEYINADADIRCGDARNFIIPSDCDSVFMCPPYCNMEEYECGIFSSRKEYDDLMNAVIDNIMNSNVKFLGIIIKEDFEYLFDAIKDKMISKEIVNVYKSHFTKNSKVSEYLYTFKINS